jgi:putative OPT family oligopeptide transporter
MTVSASIPAAVVAMGFLRGVLRRNSILESNLVQTAASSGEALAAGIIFTVPAMILLGIWQHFEYWTTTLIALGGGLLGALLMIPMRRVFVVEDQELKFPEGVACAEVLKAGHRAESTGQPGGGTGIGYVLTGLGLGAVIKLAQWFLVLIPGLKNLPQMFEWATLYGARVFYFGSELSPALLSVGYIVGLSVAIEIFMGGALGWLVGIPLLGTDGITPPAASPAAVAAIQVAKAISSEEVRYVGVGAMVVGGLASIWRVRRSLVTAAREMMSVVGGRGRASASDPTTQNISGGTIVILSLATVGLIGAVYYRLLGNNLFMTVLTTVLMVILAFFFTAVASYIVGLVGNSNSPVSGMTITAVLFTALILILAGYQGTAAMAATLGVAGIVCCVASCAGDMCNDLKTGLLVDASPRRQQWMEILAVIVTAFVLAPVMTVLHEGSLQQSPEKGGIGGDWYPAPQAVLMKSLVEGIFRDDGDQPAQTTVTLANGTTIDKTRRLSRQTIVAIGVTLGILLLAADSVLARRGSEFRLHVMPVAVGIYLPLAVSVPILAGGILFQVTKWLAGARREEVGRKGILLASGTIAGESLAGVCVGVYQYFMPLEEAPGGH